MSSLERGLGLLLAVADQGEVSAAALSRQLGVPRSTVYRHLQVLCRHELVEEDNGLYVPGWRAVSMSGPNHTHTILASLASDMLTRMSVALDETTVIAVRAGSHAVCLRQSRAHHPDHVSFKLNQLLPLHAGAGQKILLAFASAGLTRSVVSNLRRDAEQDFDAAALQGELEKGRSQGHLVSHGELFPGALAVSVPVLAKGEAVCSLTVAGRESRCDTPEWRTKALRVLHREAEEFAARITTAEDQLVGRGS